MSTQLKKNMSYAEQKFSQFPKKLLAIRRTIIYTEKKRFEIHPISKMAVIMRFFFFFENLYIYTFLQLYISHEIDLRHWMSNLRTR